eukprot:gene14382-19109_t
MRQLLVAAAASAASAARLLQSPAGEVIPGEYVVRMRRNASGGEHLRAAASYGSVATYRRAIFGFAARLDDAALQRVLRDPAVESVGPNVKVRTLGATMANATRRVTCPDTQPEPVSWGQARVTAPSAAEVGGTFAHDARWGAGVDVYVTDTGTNCDHEEF